MKFSEEDASHLGMPPYSMVYFLLSNDEVVYVGQTNVGTGRIGAHLADKSFDDVCAIRCDPADLDALEDYYIWKYMPKYNRKPNTVCSVSLNSAKTSVEEALSRKVGIRKIKTLIDALEIKLRTFNDVAYMSKKDLGLLIDFISATELEDGDV